MTKIEEIEQRLEVMEQVAKAYGIFKEEVEQLQKALAELKESKKEGKWKPALGEWYWFRVTDGTTKQTNNCNTDVDNWRIKYFPIFKTREECLRYWHFMDTVKEKSYEFSKEEWENGNIIKYYVYYDYGNGIFDVYSADVGRSFGKFYFKTEEDAQYIIDNFKDELMEYWI